MQSELVKKLLCFNKIFKRFQVLLKIRNTCLSCGIAGIGFSPDKLFINHDHSLFLEGFQMAGKVTVSYIKSFLQVVKIICLIHHQNRHNPKPDPAIKSFIQIGNKIFHASYFLYIITP